MIDLRKWRILLVLAAIFGLVFYLFYSGQILRIFYPFNHRELIEVYAEENDLDPYLIAAVIRVESKFNDKAQSIPGARGLMQVMPDTGQWIAEKLELEQFDPDDLFEPETNIRLGCWYIAHLRSSFKGNMIVTLAAYNAGRGNVQKWLAQNTWDGTRDNIPQIPFGETRHFLRKIERDYAIYQMLYKNEMEE